VSGKVRLDLNFPGFQDDLLALPGDEVRLVFKALRKLRQLDGQGVYGDPGLKWEQIKGAKGKYTIRISRSSRAIVQREGDFLRFIAIHLDHDAAYGRK
jgi:hypothetical protein